MDNHNLFQSSSLPHFLSFQYDGQALIIGRLAYAEKQVVFSRSGLMGFAHPIHEHADKNAFQYKIFAENLPMNGIVWSMPFLLWGLASVVAYLSDDANKYERLILDFEEENNPIVIIATFGE